MLARIVCVHPHNPRRNARTPEVRSVGVKHPRTMLLSIRHPQQQGGHLKRRRTEEASWIFRSCASGSKPALFSPSNSPRRKEESLVRACWFAFVRVDSIRHLLLTFEQPPLSFVSGGKGPSLERKGGSEGGRTEAGVNKQDARTVDETWSEERKTDTSRTHHKDQASESKHQAPGAAADGCRPKSRRLMPHAKPTHTSGCFELHTGLKR